MESRAKLLGHPIHPMLIVFPLGLLATSLGFDIAFLSTGNRTFGTVSYWMIAVGVCMAVLAAIPGTIDWWAIPRGTRAKGIGLLHGSGNLLVVILFAISWAMRADAPDTPSSGAITLSVIGILIALVTGWLGGELVDRMGVGVDPGAHLNSCSSLTHRPATDEHVHTPHTPGTRHA